MYTVKWILGLTLSLSMFHIALADANNCGSYSEGNTQSLCRGKSLPHSKTRGRSTTRLECSGNVDHKVRKAQEIPEYSKWADAIKREGAKSQEAFDLRQKQPEISWNGQVPYSVTEKWTWIECIHGTNGSECGYDKVCNQVPYSYQTCDSQNRCTTQTGTRTECHDVPKSCWYDVTRSATMHCSQEVMTYSAKFLRDPNWNPNSPGYNEFIPNKYDLLPGEVEDIQVFNGRGSSTTMRPSLVVGDQWNQYNPRLTGSAVGARCEQGASNHLEVAISTERRLRKPSPNAFQLPVDRNGRALSPLVWSTDTNKAGKEVKVRPKTLKLVDSSAALVGLMAKQSRRNAERERLKADLAQESNDDAKKESAQFDPFYKNTVLKVQLVEDRWFWNGKFSPPVFIQDADAISSAGFALSKIQSIRNSDSWKIPLDDADWLGTIYRLKGILPNLIGITEKGLKPSQFSHTSYGRMNGKL